MSMGSSTSSSPPSRNNSFSDGSFRGESLPDDRDLDLTSETGCLSIIVLGASGDLAKKKTFPALYHLFKQGFLPSNEVHIFGYARTKISDDGLRDRIRGYISQGETGESEQLLKFLQLIKYVSGTYDQEEGFRLLNKEISQHESSRNSVAGTSRRLFYLALPPSVYPSVCKMIRQCCMNQSHLGGWTRIVVEKPFGKDLSSAEELSSQLGELFDESQLYRIDHYLGKELVQNLLVLRFANRFFLPLWNRDNIDNIQIVFREDFGTEGRGGYFDEYGIETLQADILYFERTDWLLYIKSAFQRLQIFIHVKVTYVLKPPERKCATSFKYYSLRFYLFRSLLDASACTLGVQDMALVTSSRHLIFSKNQMVLYIKNTFHKR